ncbi:MAG TPA: hypothetical protein PK149_08650 [Flavobacteriales bacterium]|nr:hypothetical protein [Flavobacteriales bacterium]
MSTTMQRSLAALGGLFLLAPALIAQVENGGDYVIQGIFSPTIADAQKIDLRPEPIDTILPDQAVKYDVLTVKAVIPATVDSIAAARLNVVESQQKLYKGFVKGGFGLYTTPLGEVYYDQTRSRENAYGVHLKHLSSNGGLKDVGPSDYSTNKADLFYNHYLRNHEVGGRFMYDRRRVSYYGYNAVDSIEYLINTLDTKEDARKQVYNDLGFAVRVRSLYKDSTLIAHDVNLEVHAYSNLSESKETNVRITADLSKNEQGDRYGLGIVVDNNAYRSLYREGVFGEGTTVSTADKRTNGTMIGLIPMVKREGDKYVVRVGAGLYVDAQNTTTFHFYPKAYASYSLFDDILVPYIGFEGERKRNSLRSLTRENPWLIGAPALKNSSLLYDLYGGIRGSFSSKIGFDVRLGYSSTEDKPLYISAPNYPTGDRMAVVYDRVDIFVVGGELSYRHSDAMRLKARVDFYTYTTEVENEAWNLPPYKISFGGTYNLREKLFVNVEALVLGQRKSAYYLQPTDATPDATTGLITQPVEFNLNGYLDLHLGLEYRYTKRLSVFLDMSNLSASKYEQYYQYGVQRGLLIGGATYSF